MVFEVEEADFGGSFPEIIRDLLLPILEVVQRHLHDGTAHVDFKRKGLDMSAFFCKFVQYFCNKERKMQDYESE